MSGDLVSVVTNLKVVKHEETVSIADSRFDTYSGATVSPFSGVRHKHIRNLVFSAIYCTFVCGHEICITMPTH